MLSWSKGLNYSNSLPAGELIMLLLSVANFFQLTVSKKTLSCIPSECQTVWIQNRPD